MPDIVIHRSHALGLARARKVAAEWAEEAERRYAMRCTARRGARQDVITFVRSGVEGELHVAPDRFELHARLGLLLAAFSAAIHREIENHLDGLLGKAEQPAAAKPAPAKRATRKR